SVFHPEASRVAHLASGGKRGTAQSIFQVGGNTGTSLGPLLAAAIIVPFGRTNAIWFSFLALTGILVLTKVGNWYKKQIEKSKSKSSLSDIEIMPALSKKRILFSIFVLLALIFSKYFYLSSMTSYFTFYLIDKFNVSVQSSQVYLFIFLFS